MQRPSGQYDHLARVSRTGPRQSCGRRSFAPGYRSRAAARRSRGMEPTVRNPRIKSAIGFRSRAKLTFRQPIPGRRRASKSSRQERNFWMQRPEPKNPPERPLCRQRPGNVENRRQDPRRNGLFSIEDGFRGSGRLGGAHQGSNLGPADYGPIFAACTFMQSAEHRPDWLDPSCSIVVCIAGWCADCGAKAGRERCRSDRARQRPIWCENITKTHCYHFATQLGSTGWYRLEQGRALRQNCISSAVHSTTLHFSKRRRGPDSSSAHSVSSVGVRRPSVHLIKIEVVSLEPPQARFAGPHEMLARCSDIVWAEVRPVRELMTITALSRRPTSAARPSEIRGRSARSKSR